MPYPEWQVRKAKEAADDMTDLKNESAKYPGLTFSSNSRAYRYGKEVPKLDSVGTDVRDYPGPSRPGFDPSRYHQSNNLYGTSSWR